MELSSQEGEIPIPIPIPINSTYGGQMIHHHDHHQNGSSIPTNQQLSSYKKQVIKYRECLKNHAASMGGNATDGCGEFMPSGEEGTIEALNCSACNCHRNFHRKEIEGELPPSSICDFYHNTTTPHRKFMLGYPHHNHPAGTLIPSRAHHMIMGGSESDEHHDDGGGGVVLARAPPQMVVKKRFRTKFTQEQKEKMLSFAEKVGWKLQKQEEAVVQQFCQELGVKRRVLKVWMHNNKHNLAKKNNSSSPTT